MKKIIGVILLSFVVCSIAYAEPYKGDFPSDEVLIHNITTRLDTPVFINLGAGDYRATRKSDAVIVGINSEKQQVFFYVTCYLDTGKSQKTESFFYLLKLNNGLWTALNKEGKWAILEDKPK